MAAVSIHTTLVAVNAMDQGQQCAACRRLVNCYFELTLSSFRLTTPRWGCGVFECTPVASIMLARQILMHTNRANPIANVTTCGECIPMYGLLF